MGRSNPKAKRVSTTTQWHVRKLRGNKGVVTVGLPADLLEWARVRTISPFLWSPGDYVKIGLLTSGRLVIEPLPEAELRGTVIDPDIEEEAEQLAPPYVPKPYRKQRRIRVISDSGVIEEEHYVDIQHEVLTPVVKTWAKEVKSFRARLRVSQAELARLLNVGSHVTVSRWENGHNIPSTAQQERLRGLMLKTLARQVKDK
jgi:DNA-binding transcriptional regulator YiaG